DAEDDDESSDDEIWESDSDDSDSESEDEEGKYTTLASRFLKKTGGQSDRQATDKKKEDKIKKKQDRKVKTRADEGWRGRWTRAKPEESGRSSFCLLQEKPKMFAKGTEITPPIVVKKLNEILQARGKKGTDRAAQIELLNLLVCNLGRK
ncbi:unnamed protein product, partial [Ranitomeya imitator]